MSRFRRRVRIRRRVAACRVRLRPPSRKTRTRPRRKGPLRRPVNARSCAQNEKEFRDGVERLYTLTGELRDEVQNTPTAEVLSVRMYKKTEEIEKLAKLLKGKAKG